MDPPNQRTIEAIADIIRTDLKLGADARITADTPLLGGDHDLDSLDVLLLITSVEKRFGMKIPNASVRREAFASVAALAACIDELRAAQPAA